MAKYRGPIRTTYGDGKIVDTPLEYFWDEWTFVALGLMCLAISAGVALVIFVLRWKP